MGDPKHALQSPCDDHRSAEEQVSAAAILNSTSDGYMVLDRDWTIRYVNPAAEALLGMRRDELLGRNHWEVFAPAIDSRFQYEYERALTERKALELVEFYPPLNKWFEVHIYPTGPGLALFFRDATERKRVEEALKESTDRLGFALEVIHTGAWDLDLATHRLRTSLQHDRIFGYESLQPDWTYERIVEHTLPEDREPVDRLFQQALASGSDWSAEFRIRRHDDGQIRWIWAAGRHRVDGSGKSIGMGGIVQDITERKRAEEELRRSESRYRELVQSANSAIVRWSRDGTITFFNEYAQKFFGWSAEEILGKPMCLLIHERDSTGADLTGLKQEILAHPERYVNNINENVCRDGRRVWMNWANRAIYDEHGQVAGILSIGTDITARKQAEEQLKALNEHLEQRVAERTAEAQWRANQLQKLAAQMAQVEERERRRLSQALHDGLQQVLVAAKLKLGMAGRTVQDARTTAAIQAAHDLVDESIAESRSLTKELSPPVLYDGGLAAGLEWLGREMERKYQLPVTVEAAPEMEPDDLTTKLFVFQGARELILNAVKHAQASHLKVSLSRADDDRLQVVIADDGKGIDPKTIAGKEGGTGFGLFSIRERLDVIGGQLEITSAPGQGTHATITAPFKRFRQAAATVAPAARRATLQPVTPSSRASRIRVLLADDHPVLRKGLADMLREHPDLNLVGEAQDGQEAMEMAFQMRPDVVLMDISMPRMDGIEATRQIKQTAPEVSVIGLSMHETGEMVTAMKSAGASEYLTKTAPVEDLITAILRACPRK
jgi:PAS domain S-box-containing protein